MEDCQFREAESEEHKSLPINFRAPRLQLTQGKSQARIFWQSQGQIIADRTQQVVKSIGKDNRTSLISSWMAPTDAQRKLQTRFVFTRPNRGLYLLFQTVFQFPGSLQKGRHA